MKLQIDQIQNRIQATVATVRERAVQQSQALRAAGSRPQATVRRVIASGKERLGELAKSADLAKTQVDQRLGALSGALTRLASHPTVQKLATSPVGAKLVARLPALVSRLLTPAASEPNI